MIRRYWDTCCFLGWLNEEPDKVSACRAVIQEAEAGKLRIVTSAFTITEVLWPKGQAPQIAHDRAVEIHDFFRHEWIILQDVDRFIAESARDLVWNSGVSIKDSIHVASAIAGSVEQLDTYDGGPIALSGKVGTPPLVIGPPNLPETLFDPAGVEPAEE
jgi:predicted nucleic acid-binding protein